MKTEREKKMATRDFSQVYVVRDASGEYVSVFGRTPASDQAQEFDSLAEARAACDRATDRVLIRDID